MAAPTWWTWVWLSSRSWSWTGKPGLLQSIESQRVGHWTEFDNRFLQFVILTFCLVTLRFNGFSSVQFSRSVVSDSLRPHELQHARPPCPSPTPGVHSNSRPLSRWYHPAISSSVIPFSSCPWSLPASESFPVSQLCMGWTKYWSFIFSIIPSNEHPGLISLEWTGWMSLQSKGLSRVFSNTTVQKHQFSSAQLSSQSNSYIHTWLLEKL